MTKSNKATRGGPKAPATPQQVAKSAPGLRGKRRRVPHAMRTVGSPGSFSVAVRAPFSRAAEGVRLPDGNPNLSATLALTQKFALQTNADGDLDTVVLPGLYTSAFTTRGSIVGGTNLALAQEVTTANSLHAPTTSVSTAEGIGFDTVTLAGQYARYRIVS
jgi:hypothetical protein